MPFGTDDLLMTACLLLVGCAGAPEPPAPPLRRIVLHRPEPRTAAVVPNWPDAWFEALLVTTGPDEARAFLRAGFDKSDLRYRGFDGVTLAESIEAVVAAMPAVQPDAAADGTRMQFVDAIDLYWTVGREVQVGRHAGAASCLPPPR